MDIDAFEKDILRSALDQHKKSLERAAKAYELQGRKATAEALRGELATAVKLSFKVADAPTKTPQGKP